LDVSIKTYSFRDYSGKRDRLSVFDNPRGS